MKITSSKRDDVLRRKQEYESERADRQSRYDSQYGNWRNANVNSATNTGNISVSPQIGVDIESDSKSFNDKDFWWAVQREFESTMYDESYYATFKLLSNGRIEIIVYSGPDKKNVVYDRTIIKSDYSYERSPEHLGMKLAEGAIMDIEDDKQNITSASETLIESNNYTAEYISKVLDYVEFQLPDDIVNDISYDQTADSLILLITTDENDVKEFNVPLSDLSMSEDDDFSDVEEDGQYILNAVEEELGLGYQFVSSKSVRDYDGFMTSYTWYKRPRDGKNIFIFGDPDIYGPADTEPDFECDTAEEAQEWFDSYVGPGDDDDEYDDFDINDIY